MRFNTKAASDAQSQYCHEKKVPQFAPADGVCYKCKRNIYEPRISGVGTEEVTVSGISVEQARKEHITGCSYCSTSYCE
jgi:hypothetical protein